MSSPAGNSDSLLIFVWLTLFATSLLGLAIQFWTCVFRPHEKYGFSKARWLWYGIGILSLSLIGADLFDRSSEWIANVPPLVVKSALFSLVMATSWIAFGSANSRRFLHDSHRSKEKRTRERWQAVIALAVIAALSWYRCHEVTKAQVDVWELVNVESLLEVIPEVAAQTDRGQNVKLHRVSESTVGQLFTSIPATFAEHLIRSSPPDKLCNCHGWVFTNGQYVVRGRDVPIVLQGNGYEEVRGKPQPNDLVVYRSEFGEIVHTGIVRVADTDLILIESKWGFHGRYLHRLNDQAYSARHTFYRTSRPTHAMKLVTDVPEATPASGPQTRIVAKADMDVATTTSEK